MSSQPPCLLGFSERLNSQRDINWSTTTTPMIDLFKFSIQPPIKVVPISVWSPVGSSGNTNAARIMPVIAKGNTCSIILLLLSVPLMKKAVKSMAANISSISPYLSGVVVVKFSDANFSTSCPKNLASNSPAIRLKNICEAFTRNTSPRKRGRESIVHRIIVAVMYVTIIAIK